MTNQNNENWKKLIVEGFCKCKTPDKAHLTDELGESCDMCLTCNLEIDEVEENDESTCNDLVLDTESQYENSQCAEATGEPSYEFGIR